MPTGSQVHLLRLPDNDSSPLATIEPFEVASPPLDPAPRLLVRDSDDHPSSPDPRHVAHAVCLPRPEEAHEPAARQRTWDRQVRRQELGSEVEDDRKRLGLVDAPSRMGRRLWLMGLMRKDERDGVDLERVADQTLLMVVVIEDVEVQGRSCWVGRRWDEEELGGRVERMRARRSKREHVRPTQGDSPEVRPVAKDSVFGSHVCKCKRRQRGRVSGRVQWRSLRRVHRMRAKQPRHIPFQIEDADSPMAWSKTDLSPCGLHRTRWVGLSLWKSDEKSEQSGLASVSESSSNIVLAGPVPTSDGFLKILSYESADEWMWRSPVERTRCDT